MTDNEFLNNHTSRLIAVDSNGNKTEIMYRGDNLDSAIGRAFGVLNEKDE